MSPPDPQILWLLCRVATRTGMKFNVVARELFTLQLISIRKDIHGY